jgi:hypothetical protein
LTSDLNTTTTKWCNQYIRTPFCHKNFA